MVRLRVKFIGLISITGVSGSGGFWIVNFSFTKMHGGQKIDTLIL